MKSNLIKPFIYFIWLLVMFLPRSVEAAQPVEAPEYTFTALDGAQVSTNGSGYKATVLIFGRTTCSNTSYTLADVAKSDWVKSPDIRVIFAEAQKASKEDVRAFVDQYGSNDIISCYDASSSSQINGAMWFYIMRYYGSASMATLPITVLIDGNNMIRDIHLDGAQSADDLITELNKFTDTGYTTSDPYYGVNANLTINGTEDYVSANQVYQLVNQARNENGLPDLYMDKELTETAMQRAAELAVYYSHLRPDGSECFSIFPHLQAGRAENIAAGYSDSDSVMNGWLNSSGHYANIMKEDVKNIGVGSFIDNNGTRYWVQCFDEYVEHAEPVIRNRQVVRTIPVKVSFVTLKTNSNRIFSCQNEDTEIQMLIWNQNAKYGWSRPVIDASLFDFKSDNPAVMTVDEGGKVTLHGIGTAVVTATLKGDVPLSVSWTIEKKGHQRVVTTATKSYCASCGTVFWDRESGGASNQGGVSNQGGTSKPGSVSKPNSGKPYQGGGAEKKPAKVKSIKLSAPKKTLKAGKTMKLKATVKTTGSGTANTKLKWSSSKKKYAAVNQKGKVKAKKAGRGKTVTITAASTDGTKKKAKIKIKIK